MEHRSTLERVVRGVLIALVLVFFMFPIVWILMMSFQTNEQILRIPPSLAFEPTLENYRALITGRLETHAGTLDIRFMQNLWNSLVLSVCSVRWPWCWGCRPPTRSHGSGSGSERTSPSPCSRSASRPRSWCCSR